MWGLLGTWHSWKQPSDNFGNGNGLVELNLVKHLIIEKRSNMRMCGFRAVPQPPLV